MGTSSYVYAATNEDIENYQSVQRDTRSIDANQWTQSFALGLADDFDLRLGETWILSQDNTTPTGGATETTFSQGPVDPTVGATLRVIDDEEHDEAQEHFNWDWIANYSPNLFEDRAASSTEDGTNGRGGQSEGVGTALSWVIPSFTLYTEYLATYLDEREMTNADASTTDYGSYWRDSLGLNTQTRFGGRVSLNLGVTGYWNGDYSGQNQNTGVVFVTGGGNEIAFNAALNFQIAPNVFVLSLTYGNDTYSNRSYAYPAHPTFDTTTTNEDANLVGARFEYVFL